jgi:hypothetical protein
MYAYDDIFKAQKRVAAMQKKQSNIKESFEKSYAIEKVQDISPIFGELNLIENDINLTKRDLDEYMSYTGNSIRNIPSLRNISPLSRKIYSQLKQVNFKDIPEAQLRELVEKRKSVISAWNSLFLSITLLNQKGPGGTPRLKDAPFRRLYEIARDDLQTAGKYIKDQLTNVKGHNFMIGSGIPKRFL